MQWRHFAFSLSSGNLPFRKFTNHFNRSHDSQVTITPLLSHLSFSWIFNWIFAWHCSNQSRLIIRLPLWPFFIVIPAVSHGGQLRGAKWIRWDAQDGRPCYWLTTTRQPSGSIHVEPDPLRRLLTCSASNRYWDSSGNAMRGKDRHHDVSGHWCCT